MFTIKTSSRSASCLFKPTNLSKLNHNHTNIAIRFSSSASASATSASASSSTTDSSTNDENLDTPQSGHTSDSKCTRSGLDSSSNSTSNKFKSSSTKNTTTTHSTFGSAGTTSALACLPRVPSTSNIEEKQLMLDMLFTGSGPLTMPVKENHTVCPAKAMLSMSHPKSKRHHHNHNINPSQSRSTETTTVKPRPRNVRSKSYGASNSSSSTAPSLHSNMEKYKQIKTQNKITNYNVYFNKQKKFTPINTVFTNSILNTQQHNLELFNLPLKLVENLKPFENCNLPGDEMFRDEMFYIRKWEVEERLQVSKKQKKIWFDERLKMAKDGNLQNGEELFNGEIDFNEFFGFK
ncbi:unnamed protein product [Ambrosiozyma monospora]|uniref:Unnamed protein product n=1 Tax=Ambrosiozyma monospora TaxID=43982 RepID=A0A9W7DK03_AMBMO|nr:unnamed protein product [Ambrosiozyma monospora]